MTKYVLIVLLSLACLPVAADEIWSELIPDHGSISLQLFKNDVDQLDGAMLAMGSWELGGGWEADLWGVSPPALGVSVAVFGQDRFVGIGYDGNRTGGEWYERLGVYGKLPVEF